MTESIYQLEIRLSKLNNDLFKGELTPINKEGFEDPNLKAETIPSTNRTELSNLIISFIDPGNIENILVSIEQSFFPQSEKQEHEIREVYDIMTLFENYCKKHHIKYGKVVDKPTVKVWNTYLNFSDIRGPSTGP